MGCFNAPGKSTIIGLKMKAISFISLYHTHTLRHILNPPKPALFSLQTKFAAQVNNLLNNNNNNALRALTVSHIEI